MVDLDAIRKAKIMAQEGEVQSGLFSDANGEVFDLPLSWGKSHDDMMLGDGYTRFTQYNNDNVTGITNSCTIIRFDSGDVMLHHAENRFVQVKEESFLIRLYEVTDTGLFPASPAAMRIINNRYLSEETTGNEVKAGFYSYASQSSDPFAGQAGARLISERPLTVASGGFFVADTPSFFSTIKGRHYKPNTTYALVFVKLGAGSAELFYQYDWHEY